MIQHETRPRRLAWDACFNVRDLGGHRTNSQGETRWNVFVRADSLNRLRPAGEMALAEYGIHTVIDLRTPEEVQHAPNPFTQRPSHNGAPKSLHIPIIDDRNPRWQQNARQINAMSDLYRLMLDAFGGQFAAVIRAIAQAETGTVAFYCHAGKDRTGLVAALLLALVEVPHTTIAADYAFSDQNLGPLYEEMRRAAADSPEKTQQLVWQLQSLPETMLTTLAYLDEQHGGAESYLLSSGVTADEIARVRSRLLA